MCAPSRLRSSKAEAKLIELDDLDRKATEAFPGHMVRKDLVRRFRGQFPVPTYVVEFMLGRYCASTNADEIEEGVEMVREQLSARTVRAGEEELVKARARERGSVRMIDIITARLDARTDSYLATLPGLRLNDVRIGDRLVKEHERMLTGGFYTEIDLGYDATIAQEKGGRPFEVLSLREIQLSTHDILDKIAEGRRVLTTAEWKDLLLRSVGLEPAAMSARARRVAAAHDPVCRAELQHGGVGAARDRQKPSLPAGIPLRTSRFRRQSDGGADVRQHGERPAGPGLPI
jgi:ATP-dependent Lon protease